MTSANTKESSQTEQRSEPIRVAVVEDDPTVRAMLCEWLQPVDGFECVGNYAEAKSAISALAQQPPDVALVDINLPGMSGIECVLRLKIRIPSTQFVMITNYEDADHILDALASGATGYLLKRTRREDLLNAVREVFAGGSPMSSNIARKIVQSFQRDPSRSPGGEGLSPREGEVLALLARGYLYKEVADIIGISLPTVKTYIRRICEKLHVHSRAEAVALYVNLPRRTES